MCGILAVLGQQLPQNVFEGLLSRLHARGPEGTATKSGDGFQLGFTRLAINGLNEAGMQPFTNESSAGAGPAHWMCNGEIYNWKHLAQTNGLPNTSGSDCEILGPLLQKTSKEASVEWFFRSLDGVFSFVYVDTASQIAIVGRDPYGIRPLYCGFVPYKDADTGGTSSAPQGQFSLPDGKGGSIPIGSIVFASELKGLPLADTVATFAFPPGHYAAYDLRTLQQVGGGPYHEIPWLKFCRGTNTSRLSLTLKEAVKKRMLTERPVAALLSGGLDSSLIAALVQEELKKAGAPPLKTFSIGFEGSQDLKFAKIVAEHIGSEHHEIITTPDEFWAAIPDVIRDIESFDITTVRASVGNWMVSREIRRRTDCKVVFNGDGSDEVLGGYVYFYNAPSDAAFDAETERLLKNIHQFDVLRSDRCISSHGLEARTPFLDKQFVAVARAFEPSEWRPKKGERVEKQLLRMAFPGSELLPHEVIWRAKEAFSDGVSGPKSWYQICQEKALEEVGEGWEAHAARFTHLPPKTAEAYYYRTLFSRFYPGHAAAQTAVPYYWLPKWSGNATDPSARTLAVYDDAKTTATAVS
jgi:asparagine synthase (glutamine-hydrolysing)